MKNNKQTLRWLLAAVAALGLTANLAQASTFVSGNVSGTWTKTGSPYVATGNLTVPSGQTLTIQPGVTVIMGQGLNMDVEGTISAVGTAAERITIRGANSSLYWDKIYINYTGATDSSFVNCNISDATNGVYLYINSEWVGSVAMNATINNCRFTNCQASCIYGVSHGWAGWHGMSYGTSDPTLSPNILNCLFSTSSNGCTFVAEGTGASYGMGTGYGRGKVNSLVANCIFNSITGVALNLAVGANPTISNPKTANNLFLQCATALQRDAAWFNDEVSYNCFYNNQTNFVGYPPGVHGTICCLNARGTNCDLLNNIFENPLFCETTSYTLSASSPCIDAGNPGGAYLDSCFASGACTPGSLGTTVNDIGIWGGPYACAGISPPPTNAPFSLNAQKFVGVTINPTTPGRYRLEYTPTLGSTNIWTQLTNVVLLTTPWTYIDWDYPAVGQRFYRGVLLP